MAGTWTTQSKALPGMYINFRTDASLSITPGERGTVLLLQEVSAGSAGDVYGITASDSGNWPDGATAEDRFLTGEALKGASAVKVLNLGAAQTKDSLTAALTAAKTLDFDVLCYPYADTTLADASETVQAQLKEWLADMIENQGRDIQVVAPDFPADSEYVVNVAHAVVLSDNTTLTNAQTCAWVAGVTAGARINESNTGKRYPGAIDVSPRMTKSETEAAVKAGKFVFKVDSAENVTAVYDINSLVDDTAEKSKSYRKNRFIRLLNGINDDITTIFESQYESKFDNNAAGRAAFKAILAAYFLELENEKAIRDFSADDITVAAGEDSDAIAVTVAVASVDSIEKVYMTVNLS